MKHFFADCCTTTARNIKLSLRNLDMLIMSIMMPALMMIMFVFLFGGAMDIEGQFGGISYVNYVVAAVMILTIGQCASSTAIVISSDVQKGIMDRFLSMPVSKSSFLIGHVLSSVIRNIVSTIIIIGIAFAIGFRPQANFVEWLGVIAILITFMFIMAWLSVLFGLLAKTPEGAGSMTIIVMLLPYLSSGFVPTSTMPTVLRQISQNQPMTPIIETLRSLFLGTDTAQWLATIFWSIGLLIAGYVLSLLIFKKRTA